jgi:cytochrome c1
MKTPHTPGPWENMHPFITDGKNQVIAKVQAAGDQDGAIQWKHATTADLENVANAHLIAAAPEMLAALEDCAACLDGEENWNKGTRKFLLALARNAIRNAKGE